MQEKPLSLDEASALTGIPVNTLKTQLVRGHLLGVKVPKGKRMVWAIPLESLIGLEAKGEGSRYDQLIELWRKQQASGWHTGKPIGHRAIENNLDGIKDFWKKLVSQPDITLVNPENLKKAITSIPVDYESRTCHYSLKERMYKGVLSFSKLLIRESLLPEVAMLEFKKVKPKRVFPPRKTVLQDDSLTKLLQANRKLRGGRSEFDVALGEAMIGLMAYAGLRRNEVINLALKDVDLKTGVLSVINGKGHKDRIVGINSQLEKMLKDWLKHRPASASFRFLIQENGVELTKTVVQNRIYRLAKANDIDITAHGLRRTFATLNSNKGIPVDMLRLSLGHNKLETTQGYLMTDEMEAAAAIRGDRQKISYTDLKEAVKRKAMLRR